MAAAPRKPVLYLIAGSNGAGKTTFAIEFFPGYVGQVNFINADLIAKGLSPFHPESAAASAGRIVLERIAQLAERRSTFAVETTLAGRSYARMLRQMKSEGYRIHLYFLWIPSYRLAVKRVRTRVRRGGHSVPSAVVRRRFSRSLWNLFHIYYDLVDYLLLLDNTGAQPQAIAEKKDGRTMESNPRLFQRIRREAKAI